MCYFLAERIAANKGWQFGRDLRRYQPDESANVRLA